MVGSGERGLVRNKKPDGDQTLKKNLNTLMFSFL